MRIQEPIASFDQRRMNNSATNASKKADPAQENTSGSDAILHRVPAAHGFAFVVKKGSRFAIVDLEGEQIVDFMAWVLSEGSLSLEKMSTAYTRYRLSGVQPIVGECLWSNADRPLLRVVADTVKVHDIHVLLPRLV